MKVAKLLVCCGLAITASGAVFAQPTPPYVAPDQMALLKSSDPKLAANKKLVFDMWRTLVQGGRADRAAEFLTESYIQHNPNVASGRDAFVAYLKKTRPQRPIESKITFPVVSILAEGDLVMLATVSYQDDPEKRGEQYATTHFDLFRIENGKIAEHWDSVEKSAAALSYDPNTQIKKQRSE